MSEAAWLTGVAFSTIGLLASLFLVYRGQRAYIFLAVVNVLVLIVDWVGKP